VTPAERAQLDADLNALHILDPGFLEGIHAIVQGRLALARGKVPVPAGSDPVDAAMWLLAAEGVTSRLERLALAGGLVAAEIDRMMEARRIRCRDALNRGGAA
jgi:hypothetical protein